MATPEIQKYHRRIDKPEILYPFHKIKVGKENLVIVNGYFEYPHTPNVRFIEVDSRGNPIPEEEVKVESVVEDEVVEEVVPRNLSAEEEIMDFRTKKEVVEWARGQLEVELDESKPLKELKTDALAALLDARVGGDD